MEIYKKIEEEFLKGNLVVVAIDGPSGAGKSTLSNDLKERYDAVIFRIDDYFLPDNLKTKERLSEIGGYFHYERMLEEVFQTIDKEYIVSHHFNCATQSLEKREPFLTKEVIVIEGVYSHHPMLSKYMTYKVFMDVDKDEQRRRILERNGEDMLERWITEWIPREDDYFTHFDIKNLADFIINV